MLGKKKNYTKRHEIFYKKSSYSKQDLLEAKKK